MQFFKNRPLALAMCLFAVTAVLVLQIPSRFKFGLLILALCLFLALFLFVMLHRRIEKKLFLATLCSAAVLLALGSSFFFFNVRYASLQKKVGSACYVEGYVLERLDSAAYFTQLRVHLTSFDGKTKSFDAILETGYTSSLQVGDTFRADVIPREYTQDELFDEESYRLADGCLMILTCASFENCTVLPETQNGLYIRASQWNARLSYRLQNLIGQADGGVSGALLFGTRDRLLDDTKLDFRRAGVSHLLALSGLHVSILIGFIEFISRRLRIPKLLRAILIPLLALCYLALTGFAMSTWRAVLMVCILYLGFLLRAHYDSFTSLCTVLFFILLITPYAVLDISMWMSFLAAGAIIIFTPAVTALLDGMQDRRKLPIWLFKPFKALVSAISVGVVANLALLLLNGLVFGEISFVSVPATLLLSVPVTLLMLTSAILLCFPFLPFLSSFCSFLGELILKIVERFSNIHQVMLPVRSTVTQIFLVLLTISLILLSVLRMKRKRWALLPLILSIAIVLASFSATYFSPAGEATITVLNAGHGEVRLYMQNGEAVLVNDTRGNASEAFKIKNAILDANCTEIKDVIFCSYYNQASYFIAKLSSYVRVHTIHFPMPNDEREAAIATRLAQEAELHDIQVLYDADILLESYP